MARVVLSSHVRDEAVATRVLETAFRSDTRLEYENGAWRRVMVLGAQYALDRNWQFRFETTFLNGRTTYLAMTEYRFDIY